MKMHFLFVLSFLCLLASCSKESLPLVSVFPSDTKESSSLEKEKETEVTLDYNYGFTEKIETMSFSYGKPYQLPIPEISEERGNALFEGWYKENTRIETSGISFPFLSPVRLVARYTNKDFSGIHNAGGGVTLTAVKTLSGVRMIPSYYNGKKVTALASSLFYGNKTLRSLHLPEGITEIGDSCFLACPNLTEIHLPSTLKYVGELAFEDDSRLKSVYYGGDVTSWLKISFREKANPCCNKANLFFKGALVSRLVIPEGTQSIDDYAFFGVLGLSSVVFPSTLSYIGNEAFSNCRALNSVVLPSSLTALGEGVFSYCTGLTKATLPGSLTDLSPNSFSSCFSLEEASLGEGLENISQYAFYRCYSLKKAILPSTLTEIGKSAFERCSVLESPSFPSGLASIKEDAFLNCMGIEKILLPSTLTSIGRGAFAGTSSVDERKIDEKNPVYYSSGNTLLEKETKKAIAGCKDSILPEDTLLIGEQCFYDCYTLRDIQIPESVTAIGNYAFSNCTSLTGIHIGRNVSSIGKNVFTGTYALSSITIDSSNKNYQAEGNCLLDKSKTLLYFGCKVSVIPESVRTINDEAFYYCADLESIAIPSSVKSIGSRAFANCYALGSISVPDSVLSLGEGVFSQCRGMKSASFGSGLKVLPQNTLNGCTSLNAVTLSDTIEEIQSFAFYRTMGIPSLVLPSSLKTIGDGAFAVTDRSLSISSSNPNFKVSRNRLLSKDGRTLYYGNHNAVREEGIESIEPYAFYGNPFLDRVVFPSTLKTIGDLAFSTSSIQSIALPESIASIGYKAFADCDRLSSITYQGSKNRYLKIQQDGFSFYHVPAEKIEASDGEIPLFEEAE